VAYVRKHPFKSLLFAGIAGFTAVFAFFDQLLGAFANYNKAILKSFKKPCNLNHLCPDKEPKGIIIFK